MKRSTGSNQGLIIFVVVVSLLGGLFYLRGASVLKFAIESYSYEICGCQIGMEKLIWQIKDPLSFGFRELDLVGVDSKIHLTKLQTKLQPVFFNKGLFWKLKVDVKVDKGAISFTESSEAETVDSSQSKNSLREVARKLESLKRFDVSLNMKSVNVQMPLMKDELAALEIEQLGLQLQGDPFYLKWEMNSRAKPPASVYSETVSLSSKGKLQRVPERLELADAQVVVMGIPMALMGSVILQSNAVEVKAQIKDFDLAQIGLQKLETILKDWKGVVSLNAHLKRSGSFEPWVSEVTAAVKGLQGGANLISQKYSLNGPVKLDGSVRIKHQTGKDIEVPSADWNIDLTEAQLQVESLLSKPKGVSLLSHGKLQWQQTLFLENAEVQLHHLVAAFDGEIEGAKGADMSFRVAPFSLDGMEQVFPFLSAYPLSGKAEVIGHYSGDFDKPEKANLDLEKVALDKVKGSVSWKDSVVLNGPFLIDLNGSLNVLGKEVKKGSLDLKVDLSKMEISKDKQFYKPPNSTLEVTLTANGEQGALRVKKGNLKGQFGTLVLEGVVPVPPVYSIDLKASTEQISLGALKKLLPEYSSIIPNAQVKGSIATKGELNSSQLMNSRLETLGALKIWIPSYILNANSSSQPRGTDDAKQIPGPILAASRVLQGIDLSMDVLVDSLTLKQFVFNDVNVNGRIKDGILRGSSRIGKVLDGKVDFPFFEIPLFTSNPSTTFKVKAHQLDLASVIEKFLPPFKGLVAGRFTGEFSGLTKLPQSPTFLQDLQSTGKFGVVQGSLSSLPLKGYLDNKLRSIPGASQLYNKVKFPNTALEILGDFSLAKGEIMLKPVILLSGEGHQLFLEGKLGLDKKIDFEGHLDLAKLNGIGSFFEANRDSQGRLVVPIKVDGEMGRPQFYILDETLKEMVNKTIAYEKSNLTQKLKQDVQQQVQSEVEKQLKKNVKDVREQLDEKLQKQLDREFKKLFK